MTLKWYGQSDASVFLSLSCQDVSLDYTPRVPPSYLSTTTFGPTQCNDPISSVPQCSFFSNIRV